MLPPNYLSRIDNDETSDDSDVDDNFPGETLMEITTKDIPWFADFANYLIPIFSKYDQTLCLRTRSRTILDQRRHEPIGRHYGPNTTAKKVLDSGFTVANISLKDAIIL
ncbi:hypothetical protein Tco_0200336 [Tanacetum coccineum]